MNPFPNQMQVEVSPKTKLYNHGNPVPVERPVWHHAQITLYDGNHDVYLLITHNKVTT